MKAEERKPIRIRVLNSICATVMLVSIIYIVVAGFDAIALGAVALALAGAAAPVAASGDGVLEILLGIFEALVEGVVAIFEAIVNAISGLFG